MLRELVCLSGKGGTGKTTLVASLSVLLRDKVIVDADVDAPDLFIVLGPEIQRDHDFVSGAKARIVGEKCSACGQCEEICRFDAVSRVADGFSVSRIDCEGCGVCAWFCPEDAIELVDNHCGQWFESSTRFGPMIHARLFPGEESSGKLIYQIKDAARKTAKDLGVGLVLIDGPPGVACPVISSISGATHACIVTEPTRSGFNDYVRAFELCSHFKVPTAVVINKAGLNREVGLEIKGHAEGHGVRVLGEIPFDESVVAAMEKGKAVVEMFPNGGIGMAMKAVSAAIEAWLFDKPRSLSR